MFRIILLFLFLALFPFFSEAEETIPPPPMENQTQNVGQIGPFKYQRTPGAVSAFLPDISFIGSFAGGYFRDDPGDDTGENPSRTGFNFQGIELALQSVVDPYIRADVFILFLEEGVEVEDATVTTLSLPLNLQIRAGQMLAKFGRQNPQHLEQLDFVDFSRLNRRFFGDEGFSELGVEISELFPTPWFSELTFQFLQGENEGNFDGPRKGDFAYLAHWTNTFDLSPDLTLQTGLNGAFGFNASGGGNLTQIYGSDFYLRWKPSTYRGLKWQSEYFVRRRDLGAFADTEGGFYSQLIGQFARRWEGGLRFEKIGIPEGGVAQWGFSPVLTFVATEFFNLKAQYNFIDIAGHSHKQHEAFLQLQFNAGVHGAHTF
ncbi:MAG: hypothetical protein HY541_02745 [Deltaproteobacteria bacterium]|nr:hypothetical protein [Deltaproteobacteria bacterium]